PACKILLSFFSPSGYEICENYDKADKICYLPLDTRTNAREFVSIIKPSMAFFIKYEYWYNYLIELKTQRVPTFFISAKFRANQYFFKWYAPWFVAQLKNVDCFFVQDETSVKLLHSIGIVSVYCSGDTRFDRVAQIQNTIISYPWLAQFKGNTPLLVGGSTWSEDEMILSECFAKHSSQLKYLIAPHEIGEAHIKKIQALFASYPCACLSDMEKCQYKEIEKLQILIVDKIGFLSKLYKYGEIAFIGGGFGKGIHNVLEAAVFGMPILFGPQYHKFTEAVDLVEKKAAFSIKNSTEVSAYLEQWLSSAAACQQASEASANYVREHTGALNCIFQKLTPYFHSLLFNKL
ncbi:MAG: glycosyltransferase N-terminal domain-containing protein, partial [Bacteroidales bacterium]